MPLVFLPSPNVPVPATAAPTTTPSQAGSHLWKGASFSFHDLLDTINPLQHIPLIGTLYRWATGDEPGNVARIAGDGLYGGPFGLISAAIGVVSGAANVAFKEAFGKDPGEMAIALVTGSENGTEKGTPAAVVTADLPPSPAAAAAAQVTPPPAKTTPAETSVAAAPADPAAGASAKIATASPVAAQTDPASPAATGRPVPLYQSTIPPSAQSTLPGSNVSERAFLAQSSLLQRGLAGGQAAATGARPTAPVPLQVTGTALPRRAPPGAILPPPGVAAMPAPPKNTPAARPAVADSAAPSTNPAASGAAAATGPIDLSQRMMDGLDKYIRLQKQRGVTVDLSQ